jgi:hypothetical protein
LLHAKSVENVIPTATDCCFFSPKRYDLKTIPGLKTKIKRFPNDDNGTNLQSILQISVGLWEKNAYSLEKGV